MTDSSFGSLLRRHRQAAGLTQEVLAERARMSPEGVGVLERGQRQAPYRATVALLAHALDLSPEAAAEFADAATVAARPRATRATPVADRERHNLPAPPNRFLGREREIAELRALVAGGRLVTVTGAGGIGKTRTALEIGSRMVGRRENGVWFVDLAHVPKAAFDDDTSGRRVVAAIARVFELAESPSAPLLEMLTAHLAGRRVTIILDNCEHVIGDAAAVAETILRTCPHVHILATSREPLRIAFEQAYRLPNLSLPSADAARALGAEAATGFAAIDLFVQRARAVQPHFTLTHENVATVADICRRLDGIPLAIELAAARLNVLSVGALAAKLDERLLLLAGGARTALPRQQTMRALIDWSYDLLTTAEQHVFDRLSVFVGGGDLAAVAAVHADAETEFEVLELLGSLVDKSLLVVDVVDDREPRYRLLESTRAYAREKLVARGEREVVARRHALLYTAAAERFEASHGRASDAECALTEIELENWRSALAWALTARGDVGLGQRMVGALWPVWGRVSYVEGRRWIAAARALVDECTPPAVSALLELCSTLMLRGLGDWDGILADGPSAMSAFDELHDEVHAAHARCALATALLCCGRRAEAAPLLHAALAAARKHADERLIARILVELIYERSQAGDLINARVHAREALSRYQGMLGSDREAANTLIVLGEAEFQAGNVERALELAGEATATTRRHSQARYLAPVLLNFAAYSIAVGRWDEARAASIEVLGLAHETQRLTWRAWALQHLAAVAILSADVARPDRVRIGDGARVVGYVDGRIAAINSPREYTEQQEYDRVLVALGALLGEPETALLFAEGAELDEERAAALARSLST